jgi:hypothetical protein
VILEAKYRRVCRLFPAEWRDQHEEELISRLIDATEPGRDSLRFLEAVISFAARASCDSEGWSQGAWGSGSLSPPAGWIGRPGAALAMHGRADAQVLGQRLFSRVLADVARRGGDPRHRGRLYDLELDHRGVATGMVGSRRLYARHRSPLAGKTPESARTIDVPEVAIRPLVEHLLRFPPLRGRDDPPP